MPSRPVRIAVQIRPEHSPDYGAIRDTVLRAEEMGVDIAFNWDHFFPIYGDDSGPHFECWTTLGAWAEQTERIEIGPLVSSTGYRNPDLLADMARTLDHISGGRFVLGLGSGWNERDHLEYGYEFGSPGDRLRRMGVSLGRITTRLGQLNPPPLREIPILIGGGGERKTLRYVAEYAQLWHALVDADTYRRKAAILAEHCAAVGRDPAEIEHSAEVPRNMVIEDAIAEAELLAAAGVSLFTVFTDGPDYDLTNLRKVLRWRDARA